MKTSFCNCCICYSKLVVCKDVNQATNKIKKFTYPAPFKNFSFLLAKRFFKDCKESKYNKLIHIYSSQDPQLFLKEDIYVNVNFNELC